MMLLRMGTFSILCGLTASRIAGFNHVSRRSRSLLRSTFALHSGDTSKPSTRRDTYRHPQNFQLNRFNSRSAGVTELTTESEEDDLLGYHLDACWSATTWSVNPRKDPKVNQILGCLQSPAPQSLYALERAFRIAPNASTVINSCYFLVKYGFEIVLRDGLSLEDSNLSPDDWHIFPDDDDLDSSIWKRVERPDERQNAIQITKEALSLVEDTSQRQLPVDDDAIQLLTEKLRNHLNCTLGTDIRGRTCADTAFNLALAGIVDAELHAMLSKMTLLELTRVGSRPSKQGRNILQIVEKLAASGAKGGDAEAAFRLAAQYITVKGPQLDENFDELMFPNEFSLMAGRPCLWLWRYSKTLAKPVVQESTDIDGNARLPNNIPWYRKVGDTSKPLVIDVGCGYGVSLLGFATQNSESIVQSPALKGWDATQCNIVGGDLNYGAIRFANGIATRWGLERTRFVPISTEQLLQDVLHHYDGPVALILVQFPTPYKLQDEDFGNSQLPSSIESSGFMINSNMIRLIVDILRKSEGGEAKPRMLFKTNCEDVAVSVRSLALQLGLRCIQAENARRCADLERRAQTQRTSKWQARGGERATGEEWWETSPLPPKCRTETEVACEMQNNAVHQCIFELDA